MAVACIGGSTQADMGSARRIGPLVTPAPETRDHQLVSDRTKSLGAIVRNRVGNIGDQKKNSFSPSGNIERHNDTFWRSQRLIIRQPPQRLRQRYRMLVTNPGPQGKRN